MREPAQSTGSALTNKESELKEENNMAACERIDDEHRVFIVNFSLVAAWQVILSGPFIEDTMDIIW